MRNIILFFSLVAVVVSCEKNETTTPPKEEIVETSTPEKPLIEPQAPGDTDTAKAIVKIDGEVAFFGKRLASEKGSFLDAAKP